MQMEGLTNNFFGNAAWISVADAPNTASPGQMACAVRKSVEPWSDPEFGKEWAGRIRAMVDADYNTTVGCSNLPFRGLGFQIFRVLASVRMVTRICVVRFTVLGF